MNTFFKRKDDDCCVINYSLREFLNIKIEIFIYSDYVKKLLETI
jgi:hypothetical protein